MATSFELLFQKLFVTVLGTPADTHLAPLLMQQVQQQGWGIVITEVNEYLAGQAQLRGAATLVKDMALNGFGLELSDQQAASIAASVTSGSQTWADLLAFALTGLGGTLGETLANRATAAQSFTDALVDQSKGDLYAGSNLKGAAHNLLLDITADGDTLEMGTASLAALVDNLAALGLGGLASDGRVSGATVYVDANHNELLDAGEEVGETAADGTFHVNTGEGSGTLVIAGGIDILTGADSWAVLFAPSGATVVTVLSSLAEALMDHGFEDNVFDASAAVTAGLGLPPVNVLNYDPIAVLADDGATPDEYAQALEVERSSIELMNLVATLTAALVTDGGMDVDEAGAAAWGAVAGALDAGTLDLTDHDSLLAILQDAAGDALDAATLEALADVAVALNTHAEEAANIVDLAKVAVVAQGDAIGDLVDVLDGVGDMDLAEWVIKYTGAGLDDLIANASTGFLLPGIPVDSGGGGGGPDIPPTGASTTVTMPEDGTHTFVAADFGFSDVNGDAFTSVRIDTLPGAGALTLNGVAVTAGQVIAVADFAGLSFTQTEAEANTFGSNFAHFTFSVRDDSGMFDIAPRTMTIDVAAVNDAPEGTLDVVGFVVVDNPLFAIQNFTDVEGVGDIRYEWFANGVSTGVFGERYNLTDRDLGMTITVKGTYTDGGGTVETVVSAGYGPVENGSNPPQGSVTITGDAIEDATLTAVVALTDADGMGQVSLQWYSDGSVIPGETGDTLLLTQELTGHNITVRASYIDGLGNPEAVFSAPAGPVLNISDEPVGADASATFLEDGSYTFSLDDFAFTDEDNDGLLSVILTTLPAVGTLKLSGEDVTAGQAVLAADIDNLQYFPVANGNGDAYSTFTFQIRDDGGPENGGVDTDQSANTFTFNVTSVNDAPAGADKTITAIEDTEYVFDGSEFGFTDPADGDSAMAVKITTLPTDGTLLLSGSAVSSGDFISVADVVGGNLTFIADSNDNGAGYATFTFQVQDDGGTSDGGVDTDPSANTITIDVNSVNDEPAGADATVSMDEDGTYTFSAADFGFTDPIDGDSFAAVRITGFTGGGTLYIDGFTVTETTTIDIGDISLLTFVPGTDDNGTGYASIDFEVIDDGGTSDGGVNSDQSANTITIDVDSVNDAPSGTDVTVSVNEDGTYTFSTGDFGFSDAADGDSLAAVKIGNVGGGGTLYLDGISITAATVDVADIVAGLLTFVPDADDNGTGYASFDFQVQDDGGTGNGGIDTDQSANTVTIDVDSVNDEPAGADKTITILEDSTSISITAGDFGFTDPNDGDSLSAIKIGTITGNGIFAAVVNAVTVTIQSGDTIDVSGLSAFYYSPSPDEFGTDYFSFTFQVIDDGGTNNGGVDTDQTPNTITFDVLSVNDAPSGTDATLSANQDQLRAFTAADFGFSDTDGNTLLAVKLTTLPSQGTITLSGGAVTAGQSILATDIAAGNLKFIADAGENGTAYTTFTFQVQDNGGTSNGGVDLDQSANTITFDVAGLFTNGDDSVVGGTGNDTFNGMDGNDTIDGGDGNDSIFGGAGNDSIIGGTGSDTIDGGTGNDIISAGNNGDSVLGGDGDDTILGGNSADVIRGGAGNDQIDGGTSGDTYEFEPTAAGNGTDSISLTIGNNQDILAFPNTFVTAGIEAGGGAFSGGITPFTTGSNSDTNIAGKVALYAGAALGDVDTAAEVAALFQTDDMSLGANGNAVLITGTTTDSTAYIWYIVNDGTAAVATGEVTLVAVLNLGTDQVNDFDVTNFTFYAP